MYQPWARGVFLGDIVSERDSELWILKKKMLREKNTKSNKNVLERTH